MSDTTWGRQFGAESAMAVYDEVFVPRLFEPLAELVLDDLDVAPAERVLDIACGPGTVARLAARRVGPKGRVTGCDLSPVMLGMARNKPILPDSAPIEWVETAAAPLTGIPDTAYDVVTCQQGLQFFPDRPAAVAEMHRALVAGGRAGIVIWQPIERSPVFLALRGVIADVLGEESAARYQGGPWGLTDAAVVEALLGDAGFTEIRTKERTVDVTFDGGRDQVMLTMTTAPIAAEVTEVDRYALEAAGELHLSPLADDDGAVRSEVRAFVISGVRQ